MAFLDIEITGHEALLLKLSNVLGPNLIRDILDDATAAVVGRIRARYLDKVDPDGKTWIPSAAGLAREAAGGPGTLFDTGNLFHSIQEAVIDDPNERKIATDVPYAPFMQFGYTIHTKNGISTVVPPRTFLGIGQQDQEIIDAIIRSRTDRALKELQ